MGEAIKSAIEHGIITSEDLFLEDQQLLDRLRSSRLPTLIEVLARLRRPLLVSESGPTEGALHVRHKYRVVDPVVEVQQGVLARCSELDAQVGELHNRILERTRRETWLTYAGPLVPSS
jgi:hypothetical protein